MSENLMQAIAVTAELCGRTFSEGAARVFVADLAGYSEPAVIKALTRCRKEVKGFLTLADVISRIDDGRPGPEEAWAMVPISESQSVVWTDDVAKAFFVALPLIEMGDKIGARMAFKESYTKAVTESREAGSPVNWVVSLGHEKSGRAAALSEAVAKGRISLQYVQNLFPEIEIETSLALPAPTPGLAEKHIAQARALLTGTAA